MIAQALEKANAEMIENLPDEHRDMVRDKFAEMQECVE